MPFFPSFPPDANVATIAATRPDYYRPWMDMVETLMRGPSPLTVGQRELIAAWTSKLGECPYCYGGHQAAAALLGYSQELLDTMIDDVDVAGIEAEMKPLLKYVRKVALEPYKLVQADADAVFAAGWDERALHDAIAVCCTFAFMNRLVLGHGIEAIPEKFEARGRQHVEKGYTGQYAKVVGSGADKAAE
jgi:uncharacterized peroxidase-related enzyme